MIGSPGSGASSGMISQPGSPRTRIRPHGPGSPIAAPMRSRSPALVGRQIGKIGAMAFAGVNDRVTLGPHRGEHSADRLDRRTGERQVVAHLVDIAPFAAEIGLHVDDDQRRVARAADRRRRARDRGSRRHGRVVRSLLSWRSVMHRLSTHHSQFGRSARQSAGSRAGDDHDEQRENVGCRVP